MGGNLELERKKYPPEKMKVTPELVMCCAAAQIVLTTIGFILYKRPYLWAWQALEFYSETHCGTTLDEVEGRFARIEQAKHRAKVYHELIRYRTECQEDYLESFTKMFNEYCMSNTKSAFVTIPIVSSFLIVGIVVCLQWAPFHKRTLKKPGFMFAFLLSLVLVALNIGQIITILVPLINEHASPDHNYRASEKAKRMKCGFGAETTALFLVLATCILSSLIAYFIIKLYIKRIKGQEKELKKRLKKEKKKKQNKHYASTLSSVHEDVTDDDSDSDSEKGMHGMHGMHGAPPMAGGQMPMAGGSPRKLTRQDSGWGDSGSKHGFASSTPQRGKYG